MDTQMSVAEIMNLIAQHGGLPSSVAFVEELVPQMLRAVCKDEHVDAVEEFIRQIEENDWDWWPNG